MFELVVYNTFDSGGESVEDEAKSGRLIRTKNH